ncbi:MAG: cation:proton antiporter [bacterium]
MPPAFADITIVVVLAAVLGIIARLLRQPTIVAYLITGIVVGGYGLLSLDSADVLHVMATFGITLLLFLVGLQMRFDNIKSIGRTALITGIGQILFTSVIGFFIIRLLGFEIVPAMYVAIALTFSSTIIVVKLLSEKRDLRSLYGRIVVGFLIVQDVVAIFMLILLAGYQQNGESFQVLPFTFILLKSIALFGIMIWLSRRVLPWIFERLARSPELLFIASLAWAFGVSLFIASDFIGLSIEIGGFLAGIALARSVEQFQIESEIRPLRDFFIVIFFIYLGSSLVISDFHHLIVPGIILSLFVLIGNPLIMLVIMGLLGYKRKTNFYTSVTVAQVSEFGLILISLGLALGHVTSKEVSLVTLVGIITIVLSTYLILYNRIIYEKINGLLKIFERKKTIEEISISQIKSGSILLIGANRLGGHLLRAIDKKRLVIVELDPVIAGQLQKENYTVVYGDITEKDIQDYIRFDEASIIISTIPNIEDNLMLLGKMSELKKKKRPLPKIIVTSYTNWEANQMYQAGADYVILPHFVGGKHLATLVKNGQLNKAIMQQWRRHDQRILSAILKKTIQ